MASTRDGELESLSRTAARLRPWAVRGRPLPGLLFFTDPARTPDPEAVAERLPAGAGIVFRTFGAPDARSRGLRLREIARRRDLVLLVGADEALGLAIGADGLHLPERMGGDLPAIRLRRPQWLLTQAAHDLAAAEAGARSGADALVVSPVFASNSPSAGVPLGITGLKAIIAAVDAPIYALGGIRAATAEGLIGSGVVGLAAVEALAN